MPYCPHSNGQVESINQILKTMLQLMIDHHKTNWHHMLLSTLWAYRKTATSFTPFNLVHGIELDIPIDYEIPTLHSALNLLLDTSPLEQRLLHLNHLNEDHHASLQHNEAHKVCIKSHFDQQVHPRTFSSRHLILTFDVAKDKNLGPDKFLPLWHALEKI
jgi:hypothetical protein